MTKKILLLIAHDGYQPTEYGIPKELLQQAGMQVVTASNKAGIATATDGSTTPVDIIINNINPIEYDGLFLVGGSGALDSLDTPEVYGLIDSVMVQKKPYGAICISPRILAKAQALVNKKATGWNNDNKLQSIFEQYSATYIHEPVVLDGQVVTASGPQAAVEFAHAIIKLVTK